MSRLSDLLPVPPRDAMNTGLSAALESVMLARLGRPGNLTRDCSDPEGHFTTLVESSVEVGPFRVSGLRFAVESLVDVFREVKIDHPDVYAAVKTEGMLCVRARRTNPARFSNHSWGAAIDLRFGDDAVPQGTHKVERGMLLLYPYLHRRGWYWGAGFSGDGIDSMHFELATETIVSHFPTLSV